MIALGVNAMGFNTIQRVGGDVALALSVAPIHIAIWVQQCRSKFAQRRWRRATDPLDASTTELSGFNAMSGWQEGGADADPGI